jgi:hypothetical protein
MRNSAQTCAGVTLVTLMDCTSISLHREEQVLHLGPELYILPYTGPACRALQYIEISNLCRKRKTDFPRNYKISCSFSQSIPDKLFRIHILSSFPFQTFKP